MTTQRSNRFLAAALLLCLTSVALQAQTFSIPWFRIAGGGGTSTGGVFSVSGTLGQAEAGGAMTGGNFSLTAGFWSLLAVQTPGAPLLSIQLTATNTAVVSWPADAAGFFLQQNFLLGSTNWVNATNAVSQVGGQYQIVVSPAAGNRFYRLFRAGN